MSNNDLLAIMNGEHGNFEFRASNAEGGGYVPIHKQLPYFLAKMPKEQRPVCPYSGKTVNAWILYHKGVKVPDLMFRVIMGHPKSGKGEKEWVIRGYGVYKLDAEGKEVQGLHASEKVEGMNEYARQYLGEPELVPMDGTTGENSPSKWLEDYKTRQKQAQSETPSTEDASWVDAE